MKKFQYTGSGTTLKIGDDEIKLETGMSYELPEDNADVQALVESKELKEKKKPAAKNQTAPAPQPEEKLAKFTYNDHAPGYVNVNGKEIYLDTGKSYDLPEDHAIVRFLVKQGKLSKVEAEAPAKAGK